MPSLERFFNPQMRVFSANITSLPGARLYFFAAGSTTPKVTYADKQGTIPNANPVIASATGTFPPIFLDGLYRVELRSAGNIVQPGWPIDNVGQDTPIVPYASWSEIVTYAEFERVTDPLTGIVYRSKVENNLGNIPASSPDEWEVLVDPVASNYITNVDWAEFAEDGDKISLNITAPEGDFSPVSSGSSVIGSGVYTDQSGTFTKIANRVFFDIACTWTSHTGIGALKISDLPFEPTESCRIFCCAQGVAYSGQMTFGQITSGLTSVEIMSIDNTGNVTAIVIDSAATITISGSYRS